MPKIPQHDAHHMVFGAGLIGCFIGACLIRAKQRVTLHARKRIIDELSINDYKITDFEGHQYVVDNKPAFSSSDQKEANVDSVDCVWLTVKCTQLEACVEDLHRFVDESTIIMCCQNGISTHKIIKAAFPNNHVLRVMVPFNVVRLTDGHFHRGSEGRMTIEVTPVMENTAKWLARQLDNQLLPVDITYHMTALQWAKLQLNLGNALNALVDMPVKQMLESRRYRLILALMMDELIRVTTKKKIKLPKIANLPNKLIPLVLRLPDWLFSLVAQKMLAIDPNVRTSMWWDLYHKQLTEIDFLNGKVVDTANKLDVSAPANRLITALIKKKEQGKNDSLNEIEKRFDALLSSNR